MPFFPPSAPAGLGWINVKDFGARGDGAADDTAAIAAAIAALPAAGSTLYFPAGTYVTSGGLTITTPCLIRGDGGTDYTNTAVSSRITCTSPTATLFTVTALWAKFVDLALINTAATTPTAGAGIVATSAVEWQRVDYDSLTVSGFYICVDVQTGEYWVMHACNITAPIAYGIRVQNIANVDAGDWTIDDTAVTSGAAPATAAISVLSSGGGKISNTKINRDAVSVFTNGIELVPVAPTVTQDFLISNCSIEGIVGDGIHVNIGSGALWPGIVITGVQLFDTAQHPINLINAALSVIAGCVALGTHGALDPVTRTNCSDVNVLGVYAAAGARFTTSLMLGAQIVFEQYPAYGTVFTLQPPATASLGVVNVSNTYNDFSGAAGQFSGNVNGTLLAMNASGAFSGDLAHLQSQGVTCLKSAPSGDVTVGRNLLCKTITPGALDTMVYAAVIALDVTAAEIHKTTTVDATGNATINASAGGAAGQRMTVVVVNDATSGKTITFGANLKPTGPLVGTASKAATVSWISDGTAFYEISRQTGL